MKMIGRPNILINNDNKLHRCRLNFGKFNVFCGKNSSGKSTLLTKLRITTKTHENTNNRALIPDKRKMPIQESTNQKSTSPTVNGNGVLSDLFDAKNSVKTSPHYQYYLQVENSFKKVSQNFKFDIIQNRKQSNSIQTILNFSPITEERWTQAQGWGAGLRELILILSVALDSKYEEVFIEEPENHMHPEMQRRLLQFLKEETEKQYFIATHSNIFLDTNYVDKIFRTDFLNGKIKVVEETNKAKLLNDLGYAPSDNLISDLLILVEGVSDKKVLMSFLKKMNLLDEYQIKFWLLGGDQMYHADLEAFSDTHNMMVLFDNDPKSKDARKIFKSSCEKLNISVTTLKRYSIESYFPVDMYRESFNIPTSISSLDHRRPIWGQLGDKTNKKSIKRGAERIAEKIPLQDIQGTDLWQFLQDVKTKLKK